MKNFLRKAKLAIGLASFALASAHAATVTVNLPLITFDDLGITSATSFRFSANNQPYSAIVNNPQMPPAFGVILTSTGGDPTAAFNSPLPPNGSASIAFTNDLTFSVSQTGDTIASIQFRMLSALTSVTDIGGAVNQTFVCGGPTDWCDSGPVSLRDGSTSVSLLASGTYIDDVQITIRHQTNGSGTVPEPTSAALALLALTGAGAACRRRKSACVSR